MNIKDKFIELTSRTYPHGTEQEVIPLLSSELEIDEFGNLFIKIGESDVMFTSHLDTATSAITTVSHVIEDNMIKTDGKSILGADDKAGVVVMLHMIENKIPGLYYFFIGEEVGCVGSRKVASKVKLATQEFEFIKKVISFDRRGTTSIITYQSGSRCCSDKFGQALSDELNKADNTFAYKNDTTGLLTDSIQFTSIYPECTNISVGYQHEHCFTEVQDIEHLDKLAQACLKVDWNNLPVERDPSVKDYSYGGYDYGYGWGDSWDEYYTRPSANRYTYNTATTVPRVIADKIKTVFFYDKKFEYVSSLEVNESNDRIIGADLSSDRIRHERQIIDDLLVSIELNFESCTWDGFKLDVNYEFGHTTTCDRNDLIEYLPEIDYRDVKTIGGVDREDDEDDEVDNMRYD